MPNKLHLLCESITCLDETGNSPFPSGDEMAWFGYGMRAFAPDEDDRIYQHAAIVIPYTSAGDFHMGEDKSYNPLLRLIDIDLPDGVRELKCMIWLVEKDSGNDSRKNWEKMQRRFVNRIQDEVNRLYARNPAADDRLQWLPAIRDVANQLNDAAKAFEGGDEVLNGHLLEFSYSGRTGGLHNSMDDVLSPYFSLRSNDRGGKYTMNLCWHFIPGRRFVPPPAHHS